MMVDGASLRCAADWSLDALGGHTWDAETEDVTWGRSKYGACGSIGRKIVSSAIVVALCLARIQVSASHHRTFFKVSWWI